MESSLLNQVVAVLALSTVLMISGVRAWTGEIHGRVVCDVCGDSSIGPEDHVLEGSLKRHAVRKCFYGPEWQSCSS